VDILYAECVACFSDADVFNEACLMLKVWLPVDSHTHKSVYHALFHTRPHYKWIVQMEDGFCVDFYILNNTRCCQVDYDASSIFNSLKPSACFICMRLNVQKCYILSKKFETYDLFAYGKLLYSTNLVSTNVLKVASL
jgi:hypothetical protein